MRSCVLADGAAQRGATPHRKRRRRCGYVGPRRRRSGRNGFVTSALVRCGDFVDASGFRLLRSVEQRMTGIGVGQ